MRGLEDLLEEVPNKVWKDGQHHIRLILEEQARQRTAGCYPNPVILREISCKSSKEARQRSAALGEADALAGYVSSSRALRRRSAGVVHSISRRVAG